MICTADDVVLALKKFWKSFQSPNVQDIPSSLPIVHQLVPLQVLLGSHTHVCQGVVPSTPHSGSSCRNKTLFIIIAQNKRLATH